MTDANHAYPCAPSRDAVAHLRAAVRVLASDNTDPRHLAALGAAEAALYVIEEYNDHVHDTVCLAPGSKWAGREPNEV